MSEARVLIVDDEEANMIFLSELLQEGGYQHIHRVLDPRTARREVEAFEPDLILLDLIMPDLDGFGVLEELQPVLARQGYLPVLVITADITAETKRHALAAGARDFLAKPLDAIEVLLRVKNLLHTRDLYVQLQRRTDQRIREQAALIDQASDAILVYDLEDRVTFMNRAAEALYGWTADQMAAKSAMEILSPYDASKVEEANASVRRSGGWAGELIQQTREGEPLVVASRWTLLTDDKGKPRSKLIINSDITQRKRVEEKLLRAQRLENIGHLAGGIAHDLNNVFGPIRLGLELLQSPDNTAAESKQLYDSLMSMLDQGSQLVQQIQTFARGLGGQRRAVRLQSLVPNLIGLFRRTFPRSITIEASIPQQLRAIYGDPTQVHQVLTNLCVNARDAMPNGGYLRISAVDEGANVVLTVADSGQGISPATIDRIFEPFFTTKPAGQGTGLGLSTTRDIVRNHGGSIGVESQPGQGSRFIVTLPAAEEDVVPTELPAPELPSGRGETLLLVEDESSLRSMAVLTLQTAGYRVMSAQNGAEALAMFGRHRDKIRAVVMDLMMPVMEGEAAIPLMLRMDPFVPIIVSSGLIDARERVKQMGAPVWDVLPKPYSAEKLLSMVRSALDT